MRWLCIFATFAAFVFAQLPAPNAMGVTPGHLHFVVPDADVIGAPYVRKRKPSRWVHRFLREEARVTTLRGHAVMEVAGVGLGFTLTSRAALERVSFAARHYTDAPRSDVIADIFGLLYEPTVDDSTWTAARGDETDILLSQDFSFARRWRLLGGKVYVYAAAGNSIAHAGMYPWTSKDIEGGTE